MITAGDLHNLANFLVDRHGAIAVDYASQAVDELESLGESVRADAWKVLRSLVEDLVEGRLEADQFITLH